MQLENSKRRKRSQPADSPLDSAVRLKRAVLACLLLHAELLHDADDLCIEDFLLTDHHHLWATIAKLDQDGEKVDTITVSAAASPQVDIAYTSSLLDETVVLENFPQYVRRVKQARNQRVYLSLQERLTETSSDEERIALLAKMQESLNANKSKAASITRSADIPDIFEVEIPKRVSVIEALGTKKGTVTTLVSEPKQGKSYLSEALAVNVALGNDFLGKPTTRMTLIYLDCEDPLSTVQERLTVIAGGPVPNLKIWGHWLADKPAMLGDLRLLTMAKAEEPLIIVDSLRRFHDKDENNSQEMAEVMKVCRDLADAGATVILIHHAGKNGIYRGSSDILAGVDQQIL